MPNLPLQPHRQHQRHLPGVWKQHLNLFSLASDTPAHILTSPVIVYRPADDGRVTPHLIVGCTGSQCLTLIGSEHILPTRV